MGTPAGPGLRATRAFCTRGRASLSSRRRVGERRTGWRGRKWRAGFSSTPAAVRMRVPSRFAECGAVGGGRAVYSIVRFIDANLEIPGTGAIGFVVSVSGR